MTNIDDIVRERIEAARRRIAADKERRADLQAARDAGLVARHRGKLARLNAAESNSVPANGITRAGQGFVPANEPLSDQPSVPANGRLSVAANEEPQTAFVPANESYSEPRPVRPNGTAECGPKGRRPDPPEEPMPVLVAHCPSCRAERITKRVASAHVRGRPVVLVECTSTDCELIWAIRPARNYTPTAAPAAA